MKKESISAFVDSEQDEKDSALFQNKNKLELKKIIQIYRIIGESIRYKQSQESVSIPFQARLKEALQKEYCGFPLQLTRENDVLSTDHTEDYPAQEKSVI